MMPPLTGSSAFLKFLEIAYPAGGEIWLKVSQTDFYVGNADPSGNFSIYSTKGTGTERKRSHKIADAFTHLDQVCRSKDGGAFFIPGKPEGYPLKDYCHASDLISAEIDSGSIEEQWQRIERFSQISGLIPALIIGSGGKSIHAHFKLDQPIPIDERSHLGRLLAIALESDPAVVNPAQPMRIPGFFRLEKGREQTLERWSDATYSVEEVVAGFKKVFTTLGYQFHDKFSDERWRKIRAVLVAAGNVLPSELRQILKKSEEVINPPFRPQPRADTANINYSGPAPLEVFLTRDDRALITSGAGEGNRDNSGFKLAANLKATAERLQQLGIPYHGDPEQLFLDFCSRCSPPLPAKDVKRIWRSASKKSLASLPDAALEKRYSYWQWQQNPKKSRDFGSPDAQAYAEYLDWEKEQELIEVAQLWEERAGWCRQLLSKIKKRISKTTRRLKRAGKEVTPEVVSAAYPKEIKCSLSELPTLEEYVALGKPKLNVICKVGELPTPEEYEAIYESLGVILIIFDAGNRIALYKEAHQKGWKHLLDRSQTGGGKSHDAGLLSPEDFEAERIWLVTEAHRNPTTLTIELHYRDMPVRHNGHVVDSSFKTPMGNPYVRWAKKGEQPTIEGNCYRTKFFHAFAQKGYEVASNSTEATANPVCLTCKFFSSCHKENHPGSGYRYARRLIFGDDQNGGGISRVRISPKSLPASGSYSYEADVGVWDEASKIIKPTKDFIATLYDFDKMFGDLEQKLPETHAELRKVRLALRPLLNDSEFQRHGWNDSELRILLGEPPANVDDILSKLLLAAPKIEELLKDIDSVTMDDNEELFEGNNWKQRAENKKLIKRLRSMLKDEGARDALREILELASNWLIPFLEVWSGIVPGSMRIAKVKNEDDTGVVRALIVTKQDTHHAEIIEAVKLNIYLDATTSAEELSRLTGIDRSQFLVVAQGSATYSNLTIKQISGFGKLGHQRSESLSDRVAVFKKYLREKHESIAIFDFMHYAKKDGDEAWHFGTEAIGSNQFQNVQALALFGEPYKNLGVELASFQTTTGKQLSSYDEEFQAYIQNQLEKAIIQEAGRLRAHLRRDEPLTLYIVTDSDVSFLKDAFPGAKFQAIDIYALCPEAASAAQKTRHALLEAFKLATDLGEKVTQVGLAALAGISQGRLSQIAEQFGGWKVLKKILVSLYGRLYSKTNNFDEPLGVEEKWLAQSYLPLVVESEPAEISSTLETIYKGYGSKAMTTILLSLPPDTLKQLRGWLLAMLPPYLRDDFREILFSSS